MSGLKYTPARLFRKLSNASKKDPAACPDHLEQVHSSNGSDACVTDLGANGTKLQLLQQSETAVGLWQSEGVECSRSYPGAQATLLVRC